MADINIMGIISKLGPKVKVVNNITLDLLADEIAEQSGFDRGDARDFAYKFASGLIRHLTRGDSVKLGEIGTFRVSSDKDKKLKCVYRASKEISNALLTKFEGEVINGKNAGLDDMGFARLWLTENPADTVIMRDGSRITAADI